ncbi:MAG: formate dehydrogenase accessory sulfurtransferase FdhD [Metallosphaera sp.]|uniref:formate dehydrogenase accessory sulfurtransferase FdhD n=1 Tax=Metallosphaera sp. TaxID=2020860 RepID=UPI00317BEBBB
MQVEKVNLVKIREGEWTRNEDFVAIEEPLEISTCFRECKTFAIVMRTPGDDLELSLGFLYSEGIIDRYDDVVSVEVRSDTSQIFLKNENKVKSREIVVNSSCGVCGRALLYALEVLRSDVRIKSDVIFSLPKKLRDGQSAFNVTGGLHAAGLFSTEGEMLYLYEDVGRHNAVDKIVGRLLMRNELPASSTILQVSGRIGYEIVSKAIMAGIPVVSGISAPTSYAIKIAEDSGITLIGFSRGESFNVYAHPERIKA